VGGATVAGAVQATTTNANPALVNSDKSCLMHRTFLK
jgi:hypothetical protein